MNTNIKVDHMKVYNLGNTLRKTKGVVAVTIWTEDDIISAIDEREDLSEGMKAAIAKALTENTEARKRLVRNLEDCSQKWDAIDNAVCAEIGGPAGEGR